MKRLRGAEDEDDTDGYGKDVALIPVSKIVTLDTEGSSSEATKTTIQCSLPGHAPGISFPSYGAYEVHYVHAHLNRCFQCWGNFPTSHILGLHQQEHHNILAEINRERGNSIYACFVETCNQKFQTYQLRQGHLIEEHAYPSNYFFAVTKRGIDKRQSMLVEQRKGYNGHRKGSRPDRQRSKDHTAKTVAVDAQGGDTGESKDLPMADAEEPAAGQQKAANNVAKVETDKPAEKREATKEVTMGDVTEPSAVKPSELKISEPKPSEPKPTKAKPLEKQNKQDPATVDTEMDDLAGAMSCLRFVPRAIRLSQKQKARK